MTVRIGIFERPGADAMLRRTLESAVSEGHARILMTTPSWFVVLALARSTSDARYVRCDKLDEVLNAIGAIGSALGEAGADDGFFAMKISRRENVWNQTALCFANENEKLPGKRQAIDARALVDRFSYAQSARLSTSEWNSLALKLALASESE